MYGIGADAVLILEVYSKKTRKIPGEVIDRCKQRLKQYDATAKAEVDALHIAVATVHGIQYLLTWNCKHIANARTRPRVEALCRAAGYEPPILCTPEELSEED